MTHSRHFGLNPIGASDLPTTARPRDEVVGAVLECYQQIVAQARELVAQITRRSSR